MNRATAHGSASERINAAFRRYQQHKTPASLSVLEVAWLRGDRATTALCHLIGALEIIVRNGPEPISEQLAAAVEQAIECATEVAR